MIEAEGELSVCEQCQLLSVARSTYYQHHGGENEKNISLMRRIAESLMTTYSVVEDLDVFPDCCYGFVTSLEMAMIDQLLLEVTPETLRWSVVITVSLSRH